MVECKGESINSQELPYQEAYDRAANRTENRENAPAPENRQ